MELERLRKDGWFNDSREETSIPELNNKQIETIKLGKKVTVQNEKHQFLIYLRENININNAIESDLIIRQILNNVQIIF